MTKQILVMAGACLLLCACAGPKSHRESTAEFTRTAKGSPNDLYYWGRGTFFCGNVTNVGYAKDWAEEANDKTKPMVRRRLCAAILLV
jgi:hypothetical protein